ncbi:MAG: DnaJ C-terminal domain-containing protein [Gammaproteobacteria bacterium]
MEYKDYYKILGVERDAKEAEIKTAYRRLARKYHPDVSKEKNAEDKFKEIGEAYEVLKDVEKRQAYDQLGANWKSGQNFNPPPGWEDVFSHAGGAGNASGAGFSDFFESMFGGGFAQGGGAGFNQAGGFHQGDFHRGGFQSKGADQHASISITLEDAFLGAKKNIRLSSGRNLDVKIPAGITTGKRIRLAGQGSPGAGGGPNGDLYLEVTITPHRLFKVDGKNILLDLPISPWEAVLGAQVQVPTLGGRVEAKIPAGSQSGKKLRLKNRGLKGNPAGAQIVTLQIAMPESTSDEDQQYYEDMAKRFDFDPRKNL